MESLWPVLFPGAFLDHQVKPRITWHRHNDALVVRQAGQLLIPGDPNIVGHALSQKGAFRNRSIKPISTARADQVRRGRPESGYRRTKELLAGILPRPLPLQSSNLKHT